MNHSKLTTEEIFKLLQDRFHEFNSLSGFSPEGAPYDEQAHNAVIATLKDAVESFSMGRLEVKNKVRLKLSRTDDDE